MPEEMARGQLAALKRAALGEMRSFQCDQCWRDRRVETLSGAAPWERKSEALVQTPNGQIANSNSNLAGRVGN